MPYPAYAGDRMYTGGLMTAVAASGIDLTVVGLEGEGRQRGRDDGINYVGVTGGTLNEIRTAITSPLPLNAGIHATPNFRAELERVLSGADFDAAVIDSLSCGWALDMVAQRCPSATTVYVGHNHETSVWKGMRDGAKGSLPRRIAVRRNADKVARLEKTMVETTDLVVALTEHDAELFVADGAARPPVIISPGYSGGVRRERNITSDTPRHVLLVGSFKWAPKRENLRQFLEVADPAFAEAGVHFDVVGRIPGKLSEIAPEPLKATTLHGFVDDLEPLFDRARMAVIPEAIGGGFKLKTIDYAMNRIPIAALDVAVVGAPDDLRATMILEDSLPALARRIVAEIDKPNDLNQRQAAAFAVASGQFDWSVRGQQLVDAVRSVTNSGTLT